MMGVFVVTSYMDMTFDCCLLVVMLDFSKAHVYIFLTFCIFVLAVSNLCVSSIKFVC